MAADIANGTLSGGAATVTFAARYQGVEIKNLDSAVMYATTNGTAPSSGGGADQFAVGPGERVYVPNQAMLWWQGFGAADGTKNNPGTTVKLAGSTSGPYEVLGVG